MVRSAMVRNVIRHSRPTLPQDSKNSIPRNVDNTCNYSALIPDADVVVLFPGYGAKLSGDIRKFKQINEVRRMFDIASERLQFDMTKFYREPDRLYHEHGINLVEPVIFLNNLANSKLIKEANSKNIRVAGYGVGELSALVYTGWLSFEEALKICIHRSNALEDASVRLDSRQLLVREYFKSDLKKAIKYSKDFCLWKKVKQSDIICSISSYLYPECKIIGGNTLAIQFIAHNVNYFKLGACTYLSSPCAMNTSLIPRMRITLLDSIPEDRDQFAGSSEKICFSAFDGKPIIKRHQLKHIITEHARKPIKWEQTLYNIYKNEDKDKIPDTIFIEPSKENQLILKFCNLLAYRKFLAHPYSTKIGISGEN
ncbi:hypothetical protein GJ496_008730 [Pomphorhynchus laevis]|nr:hypothetical protein GJ496_008730 [Pomphorhynchus laevis]